MDHALGRRELTSDAETSYPPLLLPLLLLLLLLFLLLVKRGSTSRLGEGVGDRLRMAEEIHVQGTRVAENP
eukprot:COSAG05_NODE_447_length_9770_cov_3.824217_2_plen_71_part_00